MDQVLFEMAKDLGAIKAREEDRKHAESLAAINGAADREFAISLINAVSSAVLPLIAMMSGSEEGSLTRDHLGRIESAISGLTEALNRQTEVSAGLQEDLLKVLKPVGAPISGVKVPNSSEYDKGY